MGNSCGMRAVFSSWVQYHVQIIRLNDEEFRPNERACNPQMRYSDGHLGNFRQYELHDETPKTNFKVQSEEACWGFETLGDCRRLRIGGSSGASFSITRSNGGFQLNLGIGSDEIGNWLSQSTHHFFVFMLKFLLGGIIINHSMESANS